MDANRTIDEVIAALRHEAFLAEGPADDYSQRLSADISALCDEVERLRGALVKIRDDDHWHDGDFHAEYEGDALDLDSPKGCVGCVAADALKVGES